MPRSYSDSSKTLSTKKTSRKRIPTKKDASQTKKIAADVRRQMIAEAAYYRAEHRGFSGGNPTLDWLNAEAEIDRLLNQI